MIEIDIKKELEKYQAELDRFIRQLQIMDSQRAELTQAIAERRGIVIYLQSLNQSEAKKEKENGRN